MPELPEVETIVQSLRQSVVNCAIKKIFVRNPNLRIKIDDSIYSVEGSYIDSVLRRAKYIVIKLNNNLNIIIHLGMSGKLLVRREQDDSFNKHDHYRIYLNDTIQLTYNDPRRFGLITIQPDKYSLFSKLGVEPLSDAFDANYLNTILRNKKTPIKVALMDNQVVVGIGNIYASESLFRAGILPMRPANHLSIEEVETLVQKIKETLADAIEAGGSTLRDYSDTAAKPGYFQHQFKVYGKNKEQCQRCSNQIQTLKLAGRASFFCIYCQR